MKNRQKSEQIYSRLCEVIPGGVNSPVRACLKMKQLPLVAESGSGAYVQDVDGHTYIDYCGSWGALLHGHAEPTILKAVQDRIWKGTSFGMTTEIEEKLARKMIEKFPSVEKLRFVSSGSEATMSAIRLARGYTKRKKIVRFKGNYHGHADLFLSQAGSGLFHLPSFSSKGISEDESIILPYNDTTLLKELFQENEIAAVILEPIAGNMGVVPADLKFLQTLRYETKNNGALLIFDEVITGFRVASGGAQELYQIQPDLTCFGKIMGGGFPAAAFGGPQKIMDNLAPLGPVYQAGTLSGNPVAMEAGYQSLLLSEKENFYPSLKNKTNLLINPLQQLIVQHQIPACIQQVGSMFTLFLGVKEVKNQEDAMKCDEEAYGKFFRFLFEKGIYIPPLQQEAWFVSAAHTDEQLQYTQQVIAEFLLTH